MENSAANMVQRWGRIFLEQGAEDLMKERRGRTFLSSGARKGGRPNLIKKLKKI